MSLPSRAMRVASIPIKIRGRIIGNERTGNSAPFVLAFAIIAEMMVEAAAMPIEPNICQRINIPKYSIGIFVIKRKNNNAAIVLSKRLRRIL